MNIKMVAVMELPPKLINGRVTPVEGINLITPRCTKDLKTKHNSKSQSGKAIEGSLVFHGYINQGYKAININ